MSAVMDRPMWMPTPSRGRKLVPDERVISWVRENQPATIRQISTGLDMNHETATQRVRDLTRRGLLLVVEEREILTGKVKLYAAPESSRAEETQWVAGESVASLAHASCERFIRDEIAGALQTWAGWVDAGRYSLNWSGDAHLALALAMDTHVSRLEPHKRGAIEFVHGLRPAWGWSRHDPQESYEDALIELASIYRLPGLMGGTRQHL